ncbi:MAG: tyrosine-type recombinase/integrase [bacterium]|nr:tyrosine-type recombinase/integrase [bacterium]
MDSLRASGYAACKFRDKCRIALHFVKWTQTTQIPSTEVNESYLTKYLELGGQLSKERLAFKRALLRGFLRYLRNEGAVPEPQEPDEDTPARRLEQDYAEYLRDERGLSLRSLLVYVPHVRTFLADRVAKSGEVSSGDLDAAIVRTFLLERSRECSSEYTQLLAIALRSFFHFLFLRGRTETDLSLAITAVRKPRGAAVHAFLSPAEVERVLSTPDLATPTGRRDHAILLLLARLGLRAGEVVALELDDICWRTGELVVRGKGRVRDRLPLLKDVGAALAVYIESGRGRSECRRIFLRRIAPRVGLSGPAAIGHIVRRTFVRAGLQRPPGVAAHLFRHSLATRMLHHGASLPNISEVLRHRSAATTEIYAKVAFESLREVARPWPGEEVVQ